MQQAVAVEKASAVTNTLVGGAGHRSKRASFFKDPDKTPLRQTTRVGIQYQPLAGCSSPSRIPREPLA